MLEFRTFKVKNGKSFLGVRYPRKGQKGRYHYRFYLQVPARRAIASIKGYSSTEDVRSNDYEKAWREG